MLSAGLGWLLGEEQCGGGKLMAELHYAAGQLYNFIEGVELSLHCAALTLRSLLKNVSLEKVSLQRHFLENLTFVMSNDRVSRICLWNRETDIATTYSQESVITTILSSMTHFLGAISASMSERNSHL